MAGEVGRPLQWRPEYNEKIIELAKQGLFLEEIAECFEVDYWTMNSWTKNHLCIGFPQSYARARNLVLLALKREMREASIETKGFSARGHEFLIGQMSKPRIDGIAKAADKDKVDCVIAKLEDDLPAQDFNNLMSGLKTAFEIKNASDALEKLEKLEEKK